MLVDLGVDLTALKNDGETPLHLASDPSLRARISPHKYAEVARMLLEHGAEVADVNARDKNRWTPFILASQRGLVEVMHVPIDYGANWYPR